MYPLLLCTLDENLRLATLEHLGTCTTCAARLHIARGRLARLGSVTLPDLEELRRTRARRRRVGVGLLLVLFLLLAYALLLWQEVEATRTRAEWRFVSRLQNALHRYRADFGEFPPVGGAPLSIYLGTHDKRGPYLDLSRERMDAAGHFLDAWGGRYLYAAPGLHNPWLFDVQSHGPNARDDGGRRDNLSNWE